MKEEVIVITSHYDHVGIIDGEIHNGADDDGSGTVTVMELARQFVKLGEEQTSGPSVLFMNVVGEEKASSAASITQITRCFHWRTRWPT